MTVADRYIRALAPINSPDDDGLLEALATTVTTPLELGDSVFRGTDTHEPGETLLDPDLCPPELLRWQALLSGTTIPPNAAETLARDYLRQAAGLNRGTRLAIRQAVARTLTSGNPDDVFLVDHANGDQWSLEIVVETALVTDADATLRAAMSQSPAWLVVSYAATTGPVIDQWTRTINATTTQIDSIDDITDVT